MLKITLHRASDTLREKYGITLKALNSCKIQYAVLLALIDRQMAEALRFMSAMAPSFSLAGVGIRNFDPINPPAEGAEMLQITLHRASGTLREKYGVTLPALTPCNIQYAVLLALIDRQIAEVRSAMAGRDCPVVPSQSWPWPALGGLDGPGLTHTPSFLLASVGIRNINDQCNGTLTLFPT